MELVPFTKLVNFTKNYSEIGDTYYFEGIAATNEIDLHGEQFDIGSTQMATPAVPIYIEHNKDYPPVGAVLNFNKTQNDITIRGGILKDRFPKVIDSIKNNYFKGLSIGGGSKEKLGNTFYNNIISEVSLVSEPANTQTHIYKKSKKDYKLLFEEFKKAKDNESLVKLITMDRNQAIEFLKSQLSLSVDNAIFIYTAFIKGLYDYFNDYRSNDYFYN